jgi:hypothetical protein
MVLRAFRGTIWTNASGVTRKPDTDITFAAAVCFDSKARPASCYVLAMMRKRLGMWRTLSSGVAGKDTDGNSS